uniref:Uncharacterized protein n=1 Tax=Rhizophora mucronata TaxID=61149 RepID=A0A2P2QXD3_RHIMU
MVLISNLLKIFWRSKKKGRYPFFWLWA